MVKDPRKKTSPSPIRALNQPELVQVEEDGDGRPVSVAHRRRALKIASVEDVWEIVDEWWRASPIARRYHAVVLEDGSSATLFRDLLGGLWYRQRV